MSSDKDIYIATACVRADKISDSVQALVDAGFRAIELTGGTQYYDGYIDDLLELKEKYSLSFRCHNYFPPRPQPFVLNLASLDDETHQKSRMHIERALDLSRQVGAKEYGFHGGYYVRIQTDELGKRVKKKELDDPTKCKERFYSTLASLSKSQPDVQLYVENNVLSADNFESFAQENPLMCTEWSDFEELSSKVSGVRSLLDIGHLYVSAQTLDLDFDQQAQSFLQNSDYLHISDNDGKADDNLGLREGSVITHFLDSIDLSGKTMTLEIYNGLDEVRFSYDWLKKRASAPR